MNTPFKHYLLAISMLCLVCILHACSPKVNKTVKGTEKTSKTAVTKTTETAKTASKTVKEGEKNAKKAVETAKKAVKNEGKDLAIPTYTIEQFMNNIAVRGGSFSKDEKTLLVSNNKSGVYNAYTLPVAGGKMTKLTDATKSPAYAVSFFPNDERVLFMSDTEGNEIFHIFLREKDGTKKDLTPDSTARSTFYGWAYDEKSFFYQSNKRDPKFMDVYEMDAETFTPKMIHQNDDGLQLSLISNNKRYFALNKSVTRKKNELFLLDRETKKTVHLSEGAGEVLFYPSDFSTDSKYLYYLTDLDSEFTYLVKYDIEANKKEKFMQKDWDIRYAYFSRNGKYMVVGTNEDAKTTIEVYDQKTGEKVKLPQFPAGDITSVGISKSEQLMRFYVGNSKSPSDLYMYDFGSGKYNKLTNNLNKAINADYLVEGKVIRYPSFDKLDIPAILYKPLQASADNKVPAVVWVHGGPGGQSRLGYNGLVQCMVNQGYAVLAVNNRGSSGYGKTFFAADDQRHGEDDLQDCIYGKKYLSGLDYIDGDRIGIAGGSYGGYMTLAALTFTPDEFEVGIDVFGVSNWLRTLKSIPPWWEAFKESLYKEMGNPTTADSLRLHKISPLFHAKNITKPLMVLQGANDPRVLKAESDEIVAAVKANNVPVEYVLFEDEGHGFSRKENRIDGYGKMMVFLDKYLKKRGKN